jgi:hypothetical protein
MPYTSLQQSARGCKENALPSPRWYQRGRTRLPLLSSNISAKPRMVSARCPTTIVERFLLLVTVALTPLQEHLPTIAGYSIMYVWFIFLTSYTIFNRIHILPRVWSQPFFVTGYAMLILTTLIELLHPYSDVFEVVRIGQMFLGAMLIALLCRDRGALKSAMYGYIIAGLWMSILLFLSTYGALSGAAATSFHEASHVRKEVFGENPLQANLNLMAFVAAQGTVVAVALALMSRSLRRRNLYLGIALLCFVATFLPLSRGGILIVILTSGSILLAYGIKRVKSLMLVGTLGAAMLIWVPDAVFSRLTVVPERSNHRAPAGRVKVYTAALDHLPEYLLIGVGRGNYYEAWGMTSGYFKAASRVVRRCLKPVSAWRSCLSLFAEFSHAYSRRQNIFFGVWSASSGSALDLAAGHCAGTIVGSKLLSSESALCHGLSLA